MEGNRRKSADDGPGPSKKTRLRRMAFEADIILPDTHDICNLADNSRNIAPGTSSTVDELLTEIEFDEVPNIEGGESSFDVHGSQTDYPQNESFEDVLGAQGTVEDVFEQVRILSSELNLFEPIYPTCRVKLIDVLIKVTSIYKRYKIPKAELNEWLEHIKYILPEDNIYPDSLSNFQGLTKKLIPKLDPPVVEYFCAVCLLKSVEKFDTVCTNCSSSQIAVSVKNSVEQSLRHMLENRGLAQLLERQFDYSQIETPGIISDITDAAMYKSVVKKSIYDINLIQNTDGFPYANSNNKQIWPNFLTITEVKPNVRSHYMMLAGFWFSPTKANLIQFLTPFALEMRKLSKEGFSWQHPKSKQRITSFVHIIASTLDAQARAPALAMNYYNSNHGCCFCEAPGAKTPLKKVPLRGKKTVHTYPYLANPAPLRTHSKVLKLQREMYKNKMEKKGIPNILGVKGLSPFSLLPKFDLVNSISPDLLHSCLIGVCKRWTKQIFNSQNHGKGFYIGRMSVLVDKKIESLKFPSFVSRKPRNLTFMAFWKASEFRNWLLFTSLPCLDGILPAEFLSHHCLLVDAIYTLCKSQISYADIKRAKQMLDLFCSKYAKLYGDTELTFNLHMLLHYASSVENLGPLWAHSTFAFEGANGMMRTAIHGKQNVAMELVNTCSIYNALHVLNHIKDLGGRLLEGSVKLENVFCLGPKIVESDFNATDLDKIKSFVSRLGENWSDIKFYTRCRVERITYTSVNYARAKKTCSYFLAYKPQFNSDNKWTKILAYFELNRRQYFAGYKIVIGEPAFTGLNGYEVRHLKSFEVLAELVFYEISCIKCPLFSILDKLAEPPNMHEINL